MFSNQAKQCPLNYEGNFCSSFCRDNNECVFFSKKNAEKKREFNQSLKELLAKYKNNNFEAYNFQGFVFPEIEFDEFFFDKPLIFDDCVFLDTFSSKKRLLPKKILFNRAHFLRDATFSNSIFEEDVEFKGCHFEGIAKFDDCIFKKKSHFETAKFERDAYFRRAFFDWDAFFDNASFCERSNFRNSVFHGYASFVSTEFLGRVKFLDAVFLDELRMDSAYIGYLKDLTANNANLEGAILKETHFGTNKILKGYSFKNSYLLSVSFADRKVVDCDLTGAVFKAVLMEGWEIDDLTKSKTKYIYTDYFTKDEIDEDGQLVTTYKPLEESRVPIDGFFGEGSNVNFTLADYSREPIKWSFGVTIPSQIRTAVVNYIQFFTDFMLVTEGVSVEIRTKKEGEKLRIEFVTKTTEEKELIQERFRVYLDNATKKFENLDISFNNSQLSGVERDLFLIKYENQINSLNTELNYTQRLLKKEEEKNQQLLQFINHLSQQPRYLLNPVENTPQIYETPVFFLTADLKGYSDATSKNSKNFPIVQSFLFEQKERIEKEAACELVKLEGDNIKTFFKDGVKLVWIAKEIINEFENLKYKKPIEIEGFRIILGFGYCYKEQRGSTIDFSGYSIIETVRVDQPMKKYIESTNEQTNQIWCTKAFFEVVNGKHRSIQFEKLPKMKLDKDFADSAELYRVLIK